MMASELFLLLIPFFWGLKRGSSICLFSCGSTLFPASLSSKRENVWSPLSRMGVSRLIAVGLGGAIFSAAGYLLSDLVGLAGIFSTLGSWAYLSFGLFLMGLGAYWMAVYSDGVEKHNCSGKNGKYTFLGALSGLACLGESVISLEIFLFGGIPGLLSPGLLTAAILGGFAMSLFALGSWIPTMLTVSLLNWTAKRASFRPNMIKFGGMTASVFMMTLGSLIMWKFLPVVIGSF